MTVTPPPLRLAFMGTPNFALPTLDALAAAGHHIAAVYCQPPRPAGRGQNIEFSGTQYWDSIPFCMQSLAAGAD